MSIEQLYTIYLRNPHVQTDTRKLKNGDIYFALKGENFDGNDFVKQAFDKGASYAIVDRADAVISDTCLLVKDVLDTLQQLALYHRKQFKIPFIAITGSNGKTTTKELIAAVLSTHFKTIATIGNLNNHIGVPLTILSIPSDAQMAIIEMGANHQHEIESYCKMALPTHGLINNCGKAHLEGFGGIEGVRKGKGELYDFLRSTNGTIFRNVDLDYLTEMSEGIEHQVTYGTSSATYTGIPLQHDSFAAVAITASRLECSIQTQLVGDYNIANILGAFAIGHHIGVPLEKIKLALEEYTPDNSRSQLIHQGTNTIILDAYNANPSSMNVAIKNFMRTDYPNKVVMIGAMKELGSTSIEEHAKIIFLLEESNWNDVVLVGGDFANVKHQFIYFENAKEAQEWFQSKHFENTTFLIKGSRAFKMETVIQPNSINS